LSEQLKLPIEESAGFLSDPKVECGRGNKNQGKVMGQFKAVLQLKFTLAKSQSN